MSDRSSSTSEEMVRFLKKRVESHQGISLQQLTGHLSQLPPGLRTKYGRSIKSVKMFLHTFPEVFVIRDDTNVFLRTKSPEATSSSDGNAENKPDNGTDGEDVTSLTDVKGTVYRIFSLYGFISIEKPVKTSIYFDVKSFENAEHTSLPSSGLKVGESVICDAKMGPKDCEARFRAIHVTRADKNKLSSSHCLSLHSVNDEGAGDCDAVGDLANQSGVIERVKPNYGFIKFGRNQSDRAFFHANNVDQSLGKSIKNLPDVFAAEDVVRFDAKPSKKPTDKVKWEATMVHLCRDSNGNGANDFDEFNNNEVFVSDDEFDLQDLLQGKLEKYESSEDGLKESPVGYVDWDSSSLKGYSCNSSPKGNEDGRLLFPEWERRPKLSGERGFLYPMTESLGRIKFGPSCGLSACAAAEVTYRDEELIENLLWDVADGQPVSFDAEQAEDSTWIATLVWIGRRPAKPLVGDREDLFTRTTKNKRDAHKPLTNSATETHGHVGGEETLQNVGSRFPLIQPSITSYKNVKGVIVQVTECIGTCEVQELAASRRVKFTSEGFYKDGTMFLGYLNEALREGDTVFLDYMVGVKGRNEEIRCDLVWQGRRPGDVRQMSPEEFRRRLQKDTQNGEKVFCAEDFKAETERADEASHTSSCIPSDTGLPQDTVPTRESEASSSMSEAGLLAALPALTSNPTHMPSFGARNESPACGSAPDEFSEDLDDEVLLQLADIVVAKIIAQEERLRVDFHDIGVQTVDEDPLPLPHSGPDGLVPAIVSSGTQTLSTGEIKSEKLFTS
ncbi:uncharacterized protein LOC144157908 [Haemaphysalis longicornis]